MADTEREIFDSATSGDATATPAPDPAPAATEAAPSDDRPRDEHGRFAPKAAEEGPREAQDGQEAAPDTQEPSTGPGQQSEAERAKTAALRLARDRSQALEREVAQLREYVLRQQQPQQPAPEPPDFWDDAPGFVSAALSPLERRMQEQAWNFSAMLAERDHGKEAMQEAFRAFNEASARDPRLAQEAEAIKAAPHPWDALVQWHRQFRAMSEIGNDPAAYRERVRAELLAEIQGSPPANGSQSRPQNKIDLPSLNGATGRGNASAPAMSERELYAQATRR